MFGSRRMAFEMAEPGVDPTRIPNSGGGRRVGLRLGDAWLALVVCAFLAFGYVRFVRKPAAPEQETARPAPTATPAPEPTVAGGGFFDGAANAASGFFPISGTPTPDPTATATPAPTATAAMPEPDGIVYSVFVGENALDLQQINCICWPDGRIEGPEACAGTVPTACGGDDG
jgi:hypothetical protein